MKKSKLPIYIALLIWVLLSAGVFIKIGIDNGLGHWKFYASLIGLIISLLSLFFFNKSLKQNRE